MPPTALPSGALFNTHTWGGFFILSKFGKGVFLEKSLQITFFVVFLWYIPFQENFLWQKNRKRQN